MSLMLVMVISSTLECTLPGLMFSIGVRINGSSSVPSPAMNAGSALVFSGSGPSASIIRICSRPKKRGTSKIIKRISRHGKHHIQLNTPSSSGLKSPLMRAQTVLSMVSGLEVLS